MKSAMNYRIKNWNLSEPAPLLSNFSPYLDLSEIEYNLLKLDEWLILKLASNENYDLLEYLCRYKKPHIYNVDLMKDNL